MKTSTPHLHWPARVTFGLSLVLTMTHASATLAQQQGSETPLTRTAYLFRMGTAISGSALHVVWGGTNRRGGLGDASTIYYLRSTNAGASWALIVQLTASSSGERPAWPLSATSFM